jgi:hypothetical protein
MSRTPDPILPTLSGLKRFAPAQPGLPPDLHPVQEAALMVRMHPKSIYRLIADRKIRYFGRRGCYRVSLSDLLPVVEPNSQER